MMLGAGSSLGFVDTHFLRCARLVVNRRTVPQRRVQPPVVIVANVASQLSPELGLRRKSRPVDELGLQLMEERLHMGVLLGPPEPCLPRQDDRVEMEEPRQALPWHRSASGSPAARLVE